jgi:RNA polymerase sigma factor (sigma-70 family)
VAKPEAYRDVSDQELLDRFGADRDPAWLSILFPRYTVLLYGVCMKYLRDADEARDAVQQVFLKAFLELEKYPVTYFRSWIYQIARNYCLMELRKKNPNLQRSEVEIADESGELRTEREEKEMQLQQLEVALTHLQDDQRQCLIWFYLEKLSYQQVAERGGYSLMQVKSHIQNGKRNLRLLLEKKQMP